MSHKYTDTTISWIPMDNIFDQSLNKTILPPFHYYSELLVNLLQKHENLFQYINILQNLYLLQNGDFWNKFIEILFIKVSIFFFFFLKKKKKKNYKLYNYIFIYFNIYNY